MKLALGVLLTAALATAQQVAWPKQVVFGKSFEFEAVVLPSFDDANWSPLEVERIGAQDAPGGLERIRYRARCYQLGEVQLATDPVRTLTVQSSLPEPPGELEWPSNGWQRASASSPWLWSGLLGLGAVFAFAWWRWLRRSPQVEVEVAPQAPAFDAAAELRALDLPADDQQVARFYGELKAILRRHCAARYSVPADVRTSEEIVQAVAGSREQLHPCLQLCDGALFGRAVGDRRTHDEARHRAELFVQTAEVAS